MGKTFKYKRDLPDGSSQISDGIFQKPEGIFKYYDDIVSIRETEEDASPIVVYQFGKEQSYPERSLVGRVPNCYILHYITDGEGTYNGEKVTRGRGFLSLPGIPHSMRSDTENPWHFYWLTFGGVLAKRLMKELGLDEDNLFFEFSFFDKLAAIFDDIIYKPHDDCDPDLYLTGTFYIILSYHVKQIQRRSNIGDVKHTYVKQAMEFIDENYAQNLSIEQLALDMHISRKYLCSIFKIYTGMSTKEYLLSRRVEAASELLRTTELPLPEIAERVGYSDYTQLSKLFKNRKKISPIQYRLQKPVL